MAIHTDEENAHVTITRNDKGAKAFDVLFKDEKGNPKTHFPEEWYEAKNEESASTFRFSTSLGRQVSQYRSHTER